MAQGNSPADPIFDIATAQQAHNPYPAPAAESISTSYQPTSMAEAARAAAPPPRPNQPAPSPLHRPHPAPPRSIPAHLHYRPHPQHAAPASQPHALTLTPQTVADPAGRVAATIAPSGCKTRSVHRKSPATARRYRVIRPPALFSCECPSKRRAAPCESRQPLASQANSAPSILNPP